MSCTFEEKRIKMRIASLIVMQQCLLAAHAQWTKGTNSMMFLKEIHCIRCDLAIWKKQEFCTLCNIIANNNLLKWNSTEIGLCNFWTNWISMFFNWRLLQFLPFLWFSLLIFMILFTRNKCNKIDIGVNWHFTSHHSRDRRSLAAHEANDTLVSELQMPTQV